MEGDGMVGSHQQLTQGTLKTLPPSCCIIHSAEWNTGEGLNRNSQAYRFTNRLQLSQVYQSDIAKLPSPEEMTPACVTLPHTFCLFDLSSPLLQGWWHEPPTWSWVSLLSRELATFTPLSMLWRILFSKCSSSNVISLSLWDDSMETAIVWRIR